MLVHIVEVRRQTSVVSPHLAPWALLFTVAQDRLAEQWASGNSFASTSHFTGGACWDYRCVCYCIHFFVSFFSHVGSGGLNSGSQDHTARAIG